MVASGTEVGFVYVQEATLENYKFIFWHGCRVILFTIITSWYETKSSPMSESQTNSNELIEVSLQ